MDLPPNPPADIPLQPTPPAPDPPLAKNVPLRALATLPDTPVNLVVVGTTQSGKSTFIKLLHSYANSPIPQTLTSGNGNKAETMHVVEYPLHFESLSCPLAGDSVTSMDMEKFLSNTAFVTKPIGTGRRYFLRIIDTPGLDDNAGANKDEEHIVNILQGLQKVGEVSVVLFVIGNGMAYNGSFQRFFNYYRKMVPALEENFVILHTKWDPTSEYSTDAAYASRKKDFYDLLGRNCTHFFIHSLIEAKSARNPFAEHKKALTYNMLAAMLGHFASMKAIPIKELKYTKTETILSVDRKMISHLEGRRTGVNDAMKVFEQQESAAVSKALEEAQQITKHEVALAGVVTRLEEIDTIKLVTVGSRSAEHAAAFLNPWQTHPVTVESSFPIESTVATLSQDWTGCSWEDGEKFNSDRKTVTRTLAGNLWHGVSGTLTAKAASRVYHAEEIKNLKERKAVEEAILKGLKASKADSDDLSQKAKEQVGKFKSYLALCEPPLRSLTNERLPLELYITKLRSFYATIQAGEDSEVLLSAYCRALGVSKPQVDP